MSKIRKFIIGLAFTFGLFVQSSSALAMYSPKLTQMVADIREHVRSSQAQNGNNTILEEIEQIKAYDRAKTKLNEETGISGDAVMAMDTLFSSINPLGGMNTLLMVFNFNYMNGEFISTCLRDDIWHLEALKDLVGAEMVKAYMLRDIYHGALLSQDYKDLQVSIALLRFYGSNPSAEINVLVKDKEEPTGITSSEYFFGEKPQGDPPINPYSNTDPILGTDKGGCPEGEFQSAIEEVVHSYRTINGTIGGHSLFSKEKWGSLLEMAKANARTKAKQWIQANQISLTLGGEEGGRVESLVKGGGWDKFKGSVKTQLKIVENMVGPVPPMWEFAKWSWNYVTEGFDSLAAANEQVPSNCQFYYGKEDVYRNCNNKQQKALEQCEENEDLAIANHIDCSRYRNLEDIDSITEALHEQSALIEENEMAHEEARTAFTYKITFDSVSEENIYFMDKVMWNLNNQIQRGYEAKGAKGGLSIPTLTKNLEALSDRQCSNN